MKRERRERSLEASAPGDWCETEIPSGFPLENLKATRLRRGSQWRRVLAIGGGGGLTGNKLTF